MYSHPWRYGGPAARSPKDEEELKPFTEFWKMNAEEAAAATGGAQRPMPTTSKDSGRGGGSVDAAQGEVDLDMPKGLRDVLDQMRRPPSSAGGSIGSGSTGASQQQLQPRSLDPTPAPGAVH